MRSNVCIVRVAMLIGHTSIVSECCMDETLEGICG